MCIEVSVIVPVYNVEKYLNRCVESLLNQTYKNIEIILVNDASPDNSIAIMKEYEKKYPDIIKCIYLTKNVRQSELEVLSLEEYTDLAADDIDVIVVTATFAFDDIKKSLSELLDCNIISIEDVVYGV